MNKCKCKLCERLPVNHLSKDPAVRLEQVKWLLGGKYVDEDGNEQERPAIITPEQARKLLEAK